jgi:hypothetical protein
MNLCHKILCYKKKNFEKKIKFFNNVMLKLKTFFINNKIYLIYFNVQKNLFYIKIIFSD